MTLIAPPPERVAMNDRFVWMLHAACRGLNPELFCVDDKRGRQRGANAGIAKAKAVCDTCPVIHQCQVWVCTTIPDPTPHCVTGGLTPRERPRLYQRRPAPLCGTEQGYHRHHHYRERPCGACLDAHAAHERESSRRGVG